MPKVAVIMGSDSDWDIMKSAVRTLKEMDVDVSARVLSAHRTPEAAINFAKSASVNGFEVIIAAAGMAAHLAGVIAGNTTLPVIGVPLASGGLGGMDALLSTVQMPPGIPVATVGIGGAKNAALLAAEILSIKYDYLRDKLADNRSAMANAVAGKDKRISLEAGGI